MTASGGISLAIGTARCSNRPILPTFVRRRLSRREAESRLEKAKRSRMRGQGEGQTAKSEGRGQISGLCPPKKEETRASIVKLVTVARNCVATR